MQEVQLDKHIKLLDCPGIVMTTGGSDEQQILRNCVKVSILSRTEVMHSAPGPIVKLFSARC